MKLPDPLQLYWESIQNQWSKIRGQLPPEKNNTMLELFRPALGNTPAPAKRIMEPIIAGAGIIALLFLAAVVIGNFSMILVCSGLAYALLSEVFGIEIDLNLPPGVQF